MSGVCPGSAPVSFTGTVLTTVYTASSAEAPFGPGAWGTGGTGSTGGTGGNRGYREGLILGEEQGRTWNLKSGISEFGILAPSKFHDVEIPRFQQKSWNREIEAHILGISEFGILAPSKFHDVEIPRFQQKSWNREFEAHTRKLGIVILAYTVLPVHSVET